MSEIYLEIQLKNENKSLNKEKIFVSSEEADRVIDWYNNDDTSLNEKIKIMGSNGVDVFITKFEEIKSILKRKDYVDDDEYGFQVKINKK